MKKGKYKQATFTNLCTTCKHVKVVASFGDAVTLYRCDNKKACKLVRYREEDEERTRREQED